MKKVLAIIVIILIMWVTLGFWTIWTQFVLSMQENIIKNNGEMNIFERGFSVLLALMPIFIGIWLSKFSWRKITSQSKQGNETS